MAAGLAAGSAASVAAYYMFGHVRTRVLAWKDPFAAYDNGGYQVAQSLFAIGTGGWLGMGLCQGQPDTIPVAAEDFIFSAIAEELGIVFALCVTLICLSCYVMFLNIAMELRNPFYKLVALGLGTCYIFQVFLTIGGVTKFIPATGVTLPLVSYGGSSILSSMIMIGIIQGLYIIREDEEEELDTFLRLFRKEGHNLSRFYSQDTISACSKVIADEPDESRRNYIQMLCDCGILPLGRVLQDEHRRLIYERN